MSQQRAPIAGSTLHSQRDSFARMSARTLPPTKTTMSDFVVVKKIGKPTPWITPQVLEPTARFTK